MHQDANVGHGQEGRPRGGAGPSLGGSLRNRYLSTDDVAQIVASRASAHRWANNHPGVHHLTQLPPG
jgi:hypothetical protein